MNKVLALVVVVLGSVEGALAAPPLGAPWNRINFRVSDDALERLMQVKPLDEPCLDAGRYITNGICWSANERNGDQTISLYFPTVAEARKKLTSAWGRPAYKDKGTGSDDWTETWHLTSGKRSVIATLQPVGGGARVDLNERILLATMLTGGPPDGIGQLIGKPKAVLETFGARSDCTDECVVHLPPSEIGPTTINVEIDDKDVISRLTYIMACGQTCTKSSVVAAYARVLGRPTVTPFDYVGSAWTRITFARAPKMKLDIRDSRPEVGSICIGACED